MTNSEAIEWYEAQAVSGSQSTDPFRHEVLAPKLALIAVRLRAGVARGQVHPDVEYDKDWDKI